MLRVKKGLLAILPVVFAGFTGYVEAAGKSYGFAAEYSSTSMDFSFGDWAGGNPDYKFGSADFGFMSPYSNPAENFVASNATVSGQFSYDTRNDLTVGIESWAFYKPVDFSINLNSESGGAGRFGVNNSNVKSSYHENLFQRGPYNQFSVAGFGVSDISIGGSGSCQFECLAETFQFSIENENFGGFSDQIAIDYSDVFSGINYVNFELTVINDYSSYRLDDVSLFQNQQNNIVNHSLSPIDIGEQQTGSLHLNFNLDGISDRPQVVITEIYGDGICQGEMCEPGENEAYQNKKDEINDLLNNLGVSINLGVGYDLTQMDELAPGGSALNPVLPNVDSALNVGFEFTINTTGNELVFIDPEVAIGYDYESLEGANFLAVLLPEGVGDNLYDLWLFDETQGDYVDSGTDLVGGELYEFIGEGLSLFRILGIEADENLDPNDPEAFVTGLKFVSGGEVTLSQTALTQTVVPVPPSILFFMTGIVGLYLRKLV